MISKLKKLVKKPTVKNSFWIIGERVLQMCISFIITMITARYLGPSNYGILNYGVSFVSFFLVIVKLGIDSIIVKELISKPEQEGEILGTSLFFRVLSSGISIVLIFLIINILKPNNNVIIITTFLQSLALIFQAMSILDFWFQSKLQSKYTSIAKSIAYVVACIYKVYLLINKFSVEWFALSNVIDYLLISLFLLFFYYKKGGEKLSINFSLGFDILKRSHHFIISGLMVVIYTQIDKIMIGSMIDEAHVGYYAAAMTIHSAYGFIPDAIITSARPSIYNAQKRDKKLYIKRLQQTLSIVFWLCMIMSIGLACCSVFIINLLYGSEYSKAVIPLVILLFAVPFSNMGNIRGIWIVGENLNKYTKNYLIIGALINIILNAILIPVIGINGAAIATLITEFCTCFAPFLFKNTRPIAVLTLKSIMLKKES